MNKKAMLHMEGKDYLSGLVGLIVLAAGAIPLLEMLNILNLGFSKILSASWFSSSVPFILAFLGFYLAIESIIELTNSNSIGWMSFMIGGAIMLIGLLVALEKFGIGPGLFGFEIPQMLYYIIFVIEGLFLIIAMWSMEL
ncbi:hypothetical protein JXB27_02475 [Candidatus Woesearchaeota archaeon]|nr:hypothetical protein [Candidatus Woesearchaeota archaeon]